jgi:hypothetical protein
MQAFLTALLRERFTGMCGSTTEIAAWYGFTGEGIPRFGVTVGFWLASAPI